MSHEYAVLLLTLWNRILLSFIHWTIDILWWNTLLILLYSTHTLSITGIIKFSILSIFDKLVTVSIFLTMPLPWISLILSKLWLIWLIFIAPCSDQPILLHGRQVTRWKRYTINCNWDSINSIRMLPFSRSATIDSQPIMRRFLVEV